MLPSPLWAPRKKELLELPTQIRRTQIRDAEPARDAAVCAEIYAPYVSDSAASFEYEPPSPEHVAVRIAGAHAWLVAELDERVVGYAYASEHRQRAAYGWAADVAVYVHGGHHGAGIGRALYADLFPRLRAQGLWRLCAGITEPNAASTGLHCAMGFQLVGTYRRIGWKNGAWHDVSWWQLDLRPDETGPPVPVGSSAPDVPEPAARGSSE